MEHERFEGERTLMRIHIGESDRGMASRCTRRSSNCCARKNSVALRCCAGWAASGLRAFIIPTKSAALAGFSDRDRSDRIHGAYREDSARAR